MPGIAGELVTPPHHHHNEGSMARDSIAVASRPQTYLEGEPHPGLSRRPRSHPVTPRVFPGVLVEEHYPGMELTAQWSPEASSESCHGSEPTSQ